MPTFTPPRVLVVDDHRDAADVWGLDLRASGFTVDTAFDGTYALEIGARVAARCQATLGLRSCGKPCDPDELVR